MNNCISCLEPAKELNKGYCGKCETVIVNRLTKARDRGTGDRSPVTKDLLDEPGNRDISRADKVIEYWVFLDIQMMEYENTTNDIWCFVDSRNGHTKWFESEKDANNYLEKYHLENDGPITYHE